MVCYWGHWLLHSLLRRFHCLVFTHGRKYIISWLSKPRRHIISIPVASITECSKSGSRWRCHRWQPEPIYGLVSREQSCRSGSTPEACTLAHIANYLLGFRDTMKHLCLCRESRVASCVWAHTHGPYSWELEPWVGGSNRKLAHAISCLLYVSSA